LHAGDVCRQLPVVRMSQVKTGTFSADIDIVESQTCEMRVASTESIERIVSKLVVVVQRARRGQAQLLEMHGKHAHSLVRHPSVEIRARELMTNMARTPRTKA
jgi:hypothetical protein